MQCELQPQRMTASLADFTRPELIVPWLRETDPAGIIDELSRRLRTQEIVGDVLAFYHAAVNQEFLSSSALPGGIALPHARSPQVRRLTLAFGRAVAPVVWGIKGSWTAQNIFLIAVPNTDAGDYLPLISSLASLPKQQDVLRALQAAADAPNIFELLKTIRINH